MQVMTKCVPINQGIIPDPKNQIHKSNIWIHTLFHGFEQDRCRFTTIMFDSLSAIEKLIQVRYLLISLHWTAREEVKEACNEQNNAQNSFIGQGGHHFTLNYLLKAILLEELLFQSERIENYSAEKKYLQNEKHKKIGECAQRKPFRHPSGC